MTGYSRSQLKVDRLYYCPPAEQWFYTPDQRGIIWFDTEAEALDETGAFALPTITVESLPSDL